MAIWKQQTFNNIPSFLQKAYDNNFKLTAFRYAKLTVTA
jgi:hypothetical protein